MIVFLLQVHLRKVNVFYLGQQTVMEEVTEQDNVEDYQPLGGTEKNIYDGWLDKLLNVISLTFYFLWQKEIVPRGKKQVTLLDLSYRVGGVSVLL